MINRASVQMWGIVGPSAGRPKWAGKKNYRVPVHERDRVPVHTIRFYLHKEFRAAGIRFSQHKEFRAAGIRFYLHKRLVVQDNIQYKSRAYGNIFLRASRGRVLYVYNISGVYTMQ